MCLYQLSHSDLHVTSILLVEYWTRVEHRAQACGCPFIKLRGRQSFSIVRILATARFQFQKHLALSFQWTPISAFSITSNILLRLFRPPINSYDHRIVLVYKDGVQVMTRLFMNRTGDLTWNTTRIDQKLSKCQDRIYMVQQGDKESMHCENSRRCLYGSAMVSSNLPTTP